MKQVIERLYTSGQLTASGIADAICNGWITGSDVVALMGEEDGLAVVKVARIQQSKTALDTYLKTHPLQWTDGAFYAITSDKQQQLTSKITSATMAQTLSQPYTLTWNSTGEVCREWDLSELLALAFAIDARVTKLVSYQQTQEVSMRNAATLEALDAIEVDYDTVQ